MCVPTPSAHRAPLLLSHGSSCVPRRPQATDNGKKMYFMVQIPGKPGTMPTQLVHVVPDGTQTRSERGGWPCERGRSRRQRSVSLSSPRAGVKALRFLSRCNRSRRGAMGAMGGDCDPIRTADGNEGTYGDRGRLRRYSFRFGREVICNLLEKPEKTDWKKCAGGPLLRLRVPVACMESSRQLRRRREADDGCALARPCACQVCLCPSAFPSHVWPPRLTVDGVAPVHAVSDAEEKKMADAFKEGFRPLDFTLEDSSSDED